jgi:hypothetical protein
METFITIAIFITFMKLKLLDQEGIQYYFENELMSSIVLLCTQLH